MDRLTDREIARWIGRHQSKGRTVCMIDRKIHSRSVGGRWVDRQIGSHFTVATWIDG